MGTGMLIIALIILLAVWFAAQSKMLKNRHSNQSNLTDTQRRWRANKTRERIEDINNEITKNLEGLDAPTRQALQKLMDMRNYIVVHKRPFNLSEWLFWDIEPQFIGKYCAWTIPYFVICLLPILWGLPVDLFFIMGFWFYLDSMLYKQKLVLEVTEWNSEWHEKFGEDNK